MKFLRFSDEAAARAAFAEHLIDGSWPAYIGTAAVDVVGTIHRPTGNMLADDVPEMAALPGFHINLSDSVPELAPYEIEAPAIPYRVFASLDEKLDIFTPVKIYKQFTGKDKFALFTQEERKAITTAAMSDVDMKMFYDSFTIADYIAYDDPEMQDGLHFLEQREFITPARHAEIISKMSE